MKPLLFFAFLLLLVAGTIYFLRTQKSFKAPTDSTPEVITLKRDAALRKLRTTAGKAATFAKQKGFSTRYQFLVDMSLPSGRKRFFVYDALRDSVVDAGLVAHGSCRTHYLEEAQFSNVPECGCSSVGKYRVGGSYAGQFGKSFKLHGLDSTNSNAFKRLVVLHPYDCVPDEETDPQLICNSLGCPMVSYKFMDRLTAVIESERKPVLLWLYD